MLRYAIPLAVTALLVTGQSPRLLGDDKGQEPRDRGVQIGQSDNRPDISGDPDRPRRHFRERTPALLGPDQAGKIYDGLARSLADAYAKSGHPTATAYLDWPRYNSAPYLSATHGNTYISNYVNEVGTAYGRFEEAGKLPFGTVIAKPSFIVAKDGEIRPGPLFLMEKMEAGFKYVTGDWRYTQIMPDGVLFGETDGEDSERVEYCIGCHLAVQQQDHLFFVPPSYRVSP